MATTLSDLKAILEEQSAHLFSDGEEMLLYAFVHEGQLLHVSIHLTDEGEYLRMRIPYYLNVQESEYREGVLAQMMLLNWQLKLLKFCYNPEEDEVSVEIDLPVEDGYVTAQQVSRCMYALTVTAMEERSRLKRMAKTGIYVSEEEEQQNAIAETLDKLFADYEAPELEGATNEEDFSDDGLLEE
jgi:hypothetical protein